MRGLGQRSFIMLHHSLTPDGISVSWGAIRRYHVETMGWRDIGYHMGVELVGDHLEALVGRPEDEDAAACSQDQMNRLALHVCVVGNFDLVPPSDELLQYLARYVVAPWMLRHNIPPERIVGHNDYATYKSCPGKLFDIERFRLIAGGLSAPT
jgi:hypothetical protein